MKCENCKNLKYHLADSWYAITNGACDCDTYLYCDKEHWENGSLCEIRELNDSWDDCFDFEEVE